MLADVIRFLRCPVCRGALRHGGAALACSGGHSFDVARQGYVNLLPGGTGHRDADTPAMVRAREQFLAAGHYEPLAGLLTAHTRTAIPDPARDTCVLEAGAGTGYFLARVLDGCGGPAGAALDASKHAARRAARAHPRIGAVVADVWKELPVRSGAAAVALVVFAPRNPAELHRILNGRGRLIVVTPAPRHLREVTEPLGLLRVDESKAARLSARLRPFFSLVSQEALEYGLSLPEPGLASLALMGPSAWHIPPDDLQSRIRRIGGAADVTAAFIISVYRPLAAVHHGATGRVCR